MKFQNWVRNTVRVRKNFEIKVRARNGYGLILSNVVRVRVRVRVRIGLSLVYGNWNSFDKIWNFKTYTTLVFLKLNSNKTHLCGKLFQSNVFFRFSKTKIVCKFLDPSRIVFEFMFVRLI